VAEGAGELTAPRRQARCHCGASAIDCIGEPAKVSLCHCLDCQRRTGSLFSVAAFFERAAVQVVDGVTRSYRRGSASGHDVTFHFCPYCGTTLWWNADRLPHLIGVAVGTFADASFPMPEQAVWADERHEWLELPASLPQHSRNPQRGGGVGS
jgi:hypothetical protein